MTDKEGASAVTATAETAVGEASWPQTRAILRLIIIALTLALIRSMLTCVKGSRSRHPAAFSGGKLCRAD